MDTTMLYDHISADNKNLLAMVNHFSKFGWVVLIPKKSQTVLDSIKLWFALYGNQICFKVIMVQSLSIQL